MRPDYIGLNGFVWWHGVVEDVNDPEKMGRLRVRVLGWHTDNKTSMGIPTEDLPWATVLMPITTSSMTGLGRSPTGIIPGSWVIGFFLDGEAAQQPFVLGSYGGTQKPDTDGVDVPYNDFGKSIKKNRIMNSEAGFRDPRGLYPVEGRMGEPDTNRLVRNENVEWTIVKKKKDEVLDCDTALYGYWQEPYTPYAAKYPMNHVTESQSGHIFEVDDTPGAERLHTYHRSGTFNEVHPNGSEVHKVVGNEWNITLNDRMILVRGNTTWNTGKLMKIRVGNDLGKDTNPLQLRIEPKFGQTLDYAINYDRRLLHPVDGYPPILSSSAFFHTDSTASLDAGPVPDVVAYLDDDGYGNIRIYKLIGGKKVYLKRKAGTIDYQTGLLKIKSFMPLGIPDGAIEIIITVKPDRDIGGHLEIEVEGDMRVLVKGNTIMETQGNFLHKVKGKYTTASEGNMLFVAPRIDLNPQGASAAKIKTYLTALRRTIRKVFSRRRI